MNVLLEFIHEHSLSVDFAIFVLIWLVQLVIYPVFNFISDADFKSWHKYYCNCISFFVLPLMTAQLLESLACCFFIGDLINWCSAFLVIFVWLVTFFVSARCHSKLSKVGKDESIIRSLINTNWYRTISWSIILIISFIQY